MAEQSMNISQAAEKLGVSVRTIRRYIKAGKIKAELINGRFGEEYRISQLPPELFQPQAEARKPAAEKPPPRPPDQSIGQALDIIRELQEKNLALAAQLGVATERARNLERQVKLLSAAGTPWWKRLLSKIPR
jgi:excisionase family DNA binding protein